MRRAASGITRRGPPAAAARHGAATAAYEYELEAALFLHLPASAGAAARRTRQHRGRRPRTPPMLHYIHQRPDALAQGRFCVLIDAGLRATRATRRDVTRTYPVGGALCRSAAREIYEVVLASQRASPRRVSQAGQRPWPTSTTLAVRRALRAQGLIDLGLLSGEVDEPHRGASRYRRYYMHNTSHWLGLDVHDVGRTTAWAASTRPLEPSMVLHRWSPGSTCSDQDDEQPTAASAWHRRSHRGRRDDHRVGPREPQHRDPDGGGRRRGVDGLTPST